MNAHIESANPQATAASLQQGDPMIVRFNDRPLLMTAADLARLGIGTVEISGPFNTHLTAYIDVAEGLAYERPAVPAMPAAPKAEALPAAAAGQQMRLF